MTPRFRFLDGDINWKDYGGKFLSQKLNNSDFDYWLVIEVVNMRDATGEDDIEKYSVRLLAVSPQQAGEKKIQDALDCIGFDPKNCIGFDPKNLRNPTLTDEMKVSALVDYGVYAMLWSGSGNNINKLLANAKQQSQNIEMLFGFYMDRPENAIGANGWDFIKGDISRPIREASP